MTQYRKKPVVVEAFRVVLNTTDPGATIHHPTMRWLQEVDPRQEASDDWVWSPDGIDIPTLEGMMHAEVGDWIIRGVAGEFYPCKPDIFATTYEPVAPNTEGEGT